MDFCCKRWLQRPLKKLAITNFCYGISVKPCVLLHFVHQLKFVTHCSEGQIFCDGLVQNGFFLQPLALASPKKVSHHKFLQWYTCETMRSAPFCTRAKIRHSLYRGTNIL